MVKEWRIRDYEILRPKWGIYIKGPLSKAWGSLWQKGSTEFKNQKQWVIQEGSCTCDHRAVATQCTRSMKPQARQIPVMKSGDG